MFQACLLRGVAVTIVISETGHRESELVQTGFNILHKKDCKMKTAIIDRVLCWYGNLSFMGRSIADANAIRLESSDFAITLLETLN